MQIIVHIKEEELDNTLLQSIKSLFKNKDLTIVVDDQDSDSAYLLGNEANRQRLLLSVSNIEKGINLNEVDINDLKKLLDA